MPSTSKKQHNFMAAVANNPAFAKKAGVPQSVGKDFTEADKGKKFGSGGGETRADRQAINQPKTDHGAAALFKKGGRMATKMNPGFMAMMAKKKAGAKAETPMKKGGATKKMAAGGLSGAHKAADGVASKGKTKAMQVSMPGNKGMKKGGMTKKYC